jgi:hypothetical protein
MGKLAVVAFGIACAAEYSALATARRCDVSWCPTDPGQSVVHVRGTKNLHRDRLVPIATPEQAMLSDFAVRRAPGGELLFPSPWQHEADRETPVFNRRCGAQGRNRTADTGIFSPARDHRFAR